MKRLFVAAGLVMCALAFGVTPQPVAAETLHASMANVAYVDVPATARVGDVIEWTNNDFVAHTVTARDGSFDVTIAPGKTGSTALRKPGKTPFFCRFHPTMTGVIDVTP
ncbi:MAG: cupredoxin domain-containing protein [Acetobacteraceae bacterium]